MKKIKKRPFLLFELLLSFSILLFLFFPLIKTHFYIAHEEVKRIEKIKLEALQKQTFIDIEQALYENRFHSFDELKKGVQGEWPHSCYIDFGNQKKKEYKVKYQVVPEEYVFKKSTHERYLVFNVEISFWSDKKRASYISTFLIEEHEKT